MKTFLTATCALLLTLALAVPALAEDGGGRRKGKGRKGKHPPLGRIFHKFDADKSGSLTQDEVPERLWQRISKADADGDGAVTKEELKDAWKDRRGKGGRGGGNGNGNGGGSSGE